MFGAILLIAVLCIITQAINYIVMRIRQGARRANDYHNHGVSLDRSGRMVSMSEFLREQDEARNQKGQRK